MTRLDLDYNMHLLDLIDCGVRTEGRNGATRSLFGTQIRHNLALGFPLLTTKRVFWKAIISELLWFIKGDTNIAYLHKHNNTIWDEWADENGNLGPVYGENWRNWFGGNGTYIDQFKNAINLIKTNPTSRRNIVIAWNPATVDEAALPPCHMMFQFQVSKGKLNIHMYQRSADWFLGVPFNIASYALLCILVARETGLRPGEVIISFGDYHLYENHLEAARTQLIQNSLDHYAQVRIAEHAPDIFNLEPEHITVVDYPTNLPIIRAPVSK